jgi:hypothetical protein
VSQTELATCDTAIVHKECLAMRSMKSLCVHVRLPMTGGVKTKPSLRRCNHGGLSSRGM